MQLQLTDKVAIITGSSKGLGLASARALAAEGCRVAICARGADALNSAAAALERAPAAPARVLAVAADVSTPDGAGAVVDAPSARSAASTSSSTTSARPAAATSSRRPTPSGRARSIRRCFPRFACRASPCRTCAAPAAASIVMIASIWGRESGGRMTYNAVKAAEISLAKAMAQQLAKDNIRVNSVAPGSILFEGGTWWKRQQEDPEGIAEFIRRELPFGRFGTRRRSRRRRRVPRVAARELDHRRVHHRRRRPVALEHLTGESDFELELTSNFWLLTSHLS